MSSTAYGESLLSDIRDRNEKIRKERDREAKKNQWKALGVKAAIGLAENVLTTKHENFINQEAAFARKSGLNDTIKNAGEMLNHLEGIKDYAGGKKGYLMDNFLTDQVKQTMAQKYTPGTYNETQFNSIARKIADSYYDDFEKSFDAEADATKTFFENNDVEMYKSNREKLAGDKTIKGGMNNFIRNLPIISSLTGNISEDSIKANQDAFRLAAIGSEDVKGSREKSLKGYQEVLDRTKSTELADFVSQHITDSTGATRMLQAPPLTYTNKVENVDVFSALSGKKTGTETRVIQTGINSLTGQVESVEVINSDGSISTKSNTDTRNYNDDVAMILAGEKKDAATVFIDSQADADIKLINDKIVRQLDATDTSKMSTEAMSTFGENKSDILSAKVYHGGYTAQQQRLGTANTGRHIAFELALMNAELTENQTMKTNVGQGNVFNTLKAYDRALKKGTVAKDTVFGIINFVEENPDVIRLEYDRLSDSEKARLVTEMGEGEGKTALFFGEEIKGYNYFQDFYPEKSAANPEPEKKNTFRTLFLAIKEANRTGGELVLNFN